MIETSADYRGFFLQGKKTFGQFEQALGFRGFFLQGKKTFGLFEQSSRVSEIFFCRAKKPSVSSSKALGFLMFFRRMPQDGKLAPIGGNPDFSSGWKESGNMKT